MPIRKCVHFFEDPKAPELDADIGYSLSGFAKIAGERYCIPYNTLRVWLAKYSEGLPGVVVDQRAVYKRVYLQPAFVRFFITHIIPRLRQGLSFELITRPYRKHK